MTPWLLFCYALSLAGGVLVVGLSVLVTLVLFFGLLGWSKRGIVPERE